MADVAQMDAAVVRPRTFVPVRMMMPAPRNPIPVSRHPTRASQIRARQIGGFCHPPDLLSM